VLIGYDADGTNEPKQLPVDPRGRPVYKKGDESPTGREYARLPHDPVEKVYLKRAVTNDELEELRLKFIAEEQRRRDALGPNPAATRTTRQPRHWSEDDYFAGRTLAESMGVVLPKREGEVAAETALAEELALPDHEDLVGSPYWDFDGDDAEEEWEDDPRYDAYLPRHVCRRCQKREATMPEARTAPLWCERCVCETCGCEQPKAPGRRVCNACRQRTVRRTKAHTGRNRR
jgi:hypothetical protein